MAKTHCLLDASMDVTLSHQEQDSDIYNMTLRFVDIFGRQRNHTATIDIPKGTKFQERVSFTAMSSVNMRPGVVERIEGNSARIMLLGGDFVSLGYHKDHPVQPGETVCVIEHMDVTDPGHQLEYVALKHPLSVDQDLLRLQAINADVLDESGQLLYRLSADSILKRKSYASRMAT